MSENTHFPRCPCLYETQIQNLVDVKSIHKKASNESYELSSVRSIEGKEYKVNFSFNA